MKIKKIAIYTAIIASLAVGKLLYSQNQEPLILKQPLISIADEGTELDKEVAENVIKIGNYVVKNNEVDEDYDPKYSETDPYQTFKLKLKIDSSNYTILVSNPNAYDINKGYITMILTQPLSGGLEEEIMIIDNGNDGNIDFGTRTIGSYLEDEKQYDYSQSLFFIKENGVGLKDKEYFQEKYNWIRKEILKYIE
jgi:hypothetical protein